MGDEVPKGKLTIFLGSAAGVGKTFTMLSEARSLRRAGVDVQVGLVETHGREDTAQMVGELPVIPRKQLEYRGSSFEEMDLEAILAEHPQVVLVDELAHTNVPGVKHRKRYEDIEEILDRGIDVWATVNIQHLESLNDLVYELTGVKVRETFPDRILERADDIRLIDISPDALIERLKAGKVYAPGRVEAALSNFFRKSNLTALRDLALREVAAEVEDTATPGEVPPAVAERIMVLVRPDNNAQRLIRRGWRVSRRLDADLTVVYIERPPAWRNSKAEKLRSAEEAEMIGALRDLCRTLGAVFVELPGPASVSAIINTVKERGISQIFLGRPKKLGLRSLIRLPLVLQILMRIGDVDIHVISDRERATVGAAK